MGLKPHPDPVCVVPRSKDTHCSAVMFLGMRDINRLNGLIKIGFKSKSLTHNPSTSSYFQLNPAVGLTAEIPEPSTAPRLDDQVQCLVSVLAQDKISGDVIRKIREVCQKALDSPESSSTCILAFTRSLNDQ